MKLMENKFVQFLVVSALVLFVLGALYTAYMDYKQLQLRKAQVGLDAHNTKLNTMIAAGGQGDISLSGKPAPTDSGETLDLSMLS